MRIRADLRSLTAEQEVSYLTDKVFAGALSVIVDNVNNFSTNDYVLLGQLGSENAELMQVSSVNSSTNTITFTAAVAYDHPQDSTLVDIGYNQIIFYHSNTTTSTLSQLAAAQTIQPDDTYDYYDDNTNTTGYGWFRFYNSTTSLSSDLSNPVPYGAWDENSVKSMIESFYTQITNRERKLIREEDVIRWMNEGYSIARNRLNLVNREYTVPTPQSLTIVAGTAEYDLPTSYSKTRVVTDSDGMPIAKISYDDVPEYNSLNSTTDNPQRRYYIRGGKIGFAPTPDANDTFFHYYQTTSSVLSSYIDYIDLPNGNFYCILDFLLYRAAPIIGGDGRSRFQAFEDGLKAMVVTSHERGGGQDAWSINTSSIA